MTLALDEMREINCMTEPSKDPTSIFYQKYEKKPPEDWCEKLHKDPLEVMKDYLLLKFELGDWHGVSDAAMDIREMIAREKKGT